MPIKIRQLPSETRTIRREILRGKAREPRGTLFAQVYNENRRRIAVDDADEPQLGDVREFAVGEVAVVPCVVGYTSRDGDGELVASRLGKLSCTEPSSLCTRLDTPGRGFFWADQCRTSRECRLRWCLWCIRARK